MTEIIAIVANLALTLSLIVAVIFGVAELRTATRDRRERLTLETIHNFQSREFAEMGLYITANKLPATGKEMDVLPLADRIMIFQFSQQMESLGMMVAEGLINLDLVDKTLGSFVTTSWEKYKPLFTDLRATQPDPFLGEYFQWLAELIDKRMKETPREPYYKVPPMVKGI